MADLRRKWSTIPRAASAPIKQQHFTISRHASPRGGFLFHASRLFEIARVLVHFDHVACPRAAVFAVSSALSRPNKSPTPHSPATLDILHRG